MKGKSLPLNSWNAVKTNPDGDITVILKYTETYRSILRN